jgi:hypothetical protein
MAEQQKQDVGVEMVNQEYMDNLRSEYQRACKFYKKSNECLELARFYEYRDKNFPAAAGLYKWLCDGFDNGPACLHRGMLQLAGRAETTLEFSDPDKIIVGEKMKSPVTEPAPPAQSKDNQQPYQYADKRDFLGAYKNFMKACKKAESKACQNAGLESLPLS